MGLLDERNDTPVAQPHRLELAERLHHVDLAPSRKKDELRRNPSRKIYRADACKLRVDHAGTKDSLGDASTTDVVRLDVERARRREE